MAIVGPSKVQPIRLDEPGGITVRGTQPDIDEGAGFNGDVDLALEGLPDGIKYDLGKIPAGVPEVTLKLNVTDKAALGTNYSFTVVGTAVFNEHNYKTRTGKIALSVNAPEALEIVTNSTPAKVEASGVK